MSKIFCVEDDPNIRELIEYTLDSFRAEKENLTLEKILDADSEARSTVYRKSEEIRIKI